MIGKIYESKTVKLNEINELDYGDILEYAFNGAKQDVFLLKIFYFFYLKIHWKWKLKILLKIILDCVLRKN